MIRKAAIALSLLATWPAFAQDCVPQRIVASDASPGDRFGWSVAMLDSTAIIGAPGAKDGAGAAYILRRQPNNEWIEVQKLVPVDAVEGAGFGWAVALIDSHLVVGAPYARGAGTDREGAAYVFSLGPNGTWHETDRLAAEARDDSSGFGWSVDLSQLTVGDPERRTLVALVGAPHSRVGNGARSGRTFVYEPDAIGTWLETSIPSPWAGDGDKFGWSVSVTSGSGVVGAPGVIRSDGFAGRAHGLARDSSGWILTEEIQPPDSLRLHEFGYAVAESDWVGAPGGARPGAESGVFRFLGRPTQSKPEFYIPAAGQGWTATQLDLGPRLGFAIAFGSGRPSNVGAMVVGIPAREGPGMVLRFSGGAGFRFSPAGTLEEPTTVSGSGFGTSVAVSLGILAVGAPGPPGSDGGSGTLYIFTPAGLLSTGHDRSFPARIDGVNMYPNPVRHRVNLRLSLFESGSVATTFYDIQGRKRRVHDHGILAPGIHDITLDTRALAPGVYAYTVEAAGEVVRGTIVVVR